MTTTPGRIVWYGVRTPGYNNVRYDELVRRLPSVDPWEIRLRGSRWLWHPELKAYHRLSRWLIDPLLLHRLSRRYGYLLSTGDLHRVDQFDGGAVVDVDDPVFSPELTAGLNKPRVRAVVTTTEQLRRRLIGEGVRKPVVVIPQGVDLDALDERRVAAIRRAFRDAGDLVVGVSAPELYRESECQGMPRRSMYDIELALQAVARLRRHVSGAVLWLFGRPSRAVAEYARSSGFVRLFGYLPRRELLNHIACCDVALYPRKLDFGGRASIKLMEYMGCSVPIVSTSVSESFVVGESDAGLIADGADRFAGALEEMARSPQMRSTFVANGRGFAARHDWKLIAERYEREVFDVYCP